jgi:putative heme-binding domain-containing protein
VVEQFQHVAKLPGDIARGKEVFRKRCATCHRLENEGYAVGPDLLALTNKTPESLLIAVLDPNRAVEEKFLDYIAITNDGRQFNGVLQDETGASLTLAAADGKTQVLLRKDLETLVATGKSLMPEGMEMDVTAEELADVIAYVRSVGPPPKEFPGNRPEVVRVSISGRLQCLATNCRIYGPTVVFEPQYGNLGYWQSEEDRAVWTLEVPQSGRYRVTLDYACHNDAAGDAYVLEVAGQTLTGRVEGTGTWDNYRGQSLGEVELPQGTVEMQFRSAGPIRQALLDLREVRLTPVK